MFCLPKFTLPIVRVYLLLVHIIINCIKIIIEHNFFSIYYNQFAGSMKELFLIALINDEKQVLPQTFLAKINRCKIFLKIAYPKPLFICLFLPSQPQSGLKPLFVKENFPCFFPYSNPWCYENPNPQIRSRRKVIQQIKVKVWTEHFLGAYLVDVIPGVFYLFSYLLLSANIRYPSTICLHSCFISSCFLCIVSFLISQGETACPFESRFLLHLHSVDPVHNN